VVFSNFGETIVGDANAAAAQVTLGILDEDDMTSDSASYPPTQQSVKAYVEDGSITMTNKTLTSPIFTSPTINTSITGTAVLDEDDMASDSSTQIATQQSIKAYVDNFPQSNIVAQMVHMSDGAVATGTTELPFDDTKPQNTEGDEYMTLAITPSSASNKLKIDVVIYLSHTNTSSTVSASLFQDSSADALAVGAVFMNASGLVCLSYTHWMVAGTTSSTTFKVRAGANTSGTSTFNGTGGSRFFGGVMASSITITELDV